MGKYDGKVTIGTALDLMGLKKGVGGVSGALGGLSGILTKLGGLLATVFSVRAITNFSKEAIQLGSDLQEVQNVVDVTFSTMNQQVNDFAKSAMHTAGLSETMAKRYTGTFGAMAKSFKFTEEDAFAMSATLTQLTGDVASFYNLSQDAAYTKLKAVFTGETESLKDLGVVMTQTALDEYALQQGMSKTTAQMSEQEKVALRYKFVLEQLSGASGDFSRTSGSWANQTRLLTLQFDQLKATIGQGLINALTPVLRVINTLIARLQVLANSAMPPAARPVHPPPWRTTTNRRQRVPEQLLMKLYAPARLRRSTWQASMKSRNWAILPAAVPVVPVAEVAARSAATSIFRRSI